MLVDKEIKKTYWAIVKNKPKKDYGAYVWGWDSEKGESFEQEKCAGSDR